MKLVFISDTHCRHRKLSIPECDVLIHCGDISDDGELEVLADFATWCDELRAQGRIGEAVAIAGNHDTVLDPFHKKAKRNGGRTRDKVLEIFDDNHVHYLQDSGAVVAGLSFYGVPWTSRCREWAFGYENKATAELVFQEKMPKQVDVLVTHMPPYRIMDKLSEPDQDGISHLGEPALREQLSRGGKYGGTEVLVHAFGHVHDCYGIATGKFAPLSGITFVNAAIAGRNRPIVVDLV